MANPSISEVRLLSTAKLTTVKPDYETAHVKAIGSTFLDSSTPDRYVAVLFAYRLADNSQAVYSQLLKRIKQSLEYVLVPFFSFAGRWTACPRGSSRQRLLCNDAGVPFIEAYVNKDMDTVVKASTAFQPILELQGHGLVGIDVTQVNAKSMVPNGLPSMFVQVTRFQCGGVVLAVNFNHVQTDGTGFFNFMTAWSDISRTNKTTVEVDHDRAQAELPFMKEIFPGQQNANDTPSSNGAGGAEPASKSGLWIMKAFEVSASAVESLKQEAKNRKDNGPGYVSTGDCILANLWRGLAGLTPSLRDEREILLTISVEGRTRFYDPPIPKLCGNVYSTMLSPEIPSHELLDMPLVSIASRLRETLLTTKREDWLGLERFRKTLQRIGGSTHVQWSITSWFNFPMYEMDFGFGKPYFAGLNTNFRFKRQQQNVPLGVAFIGPPIPKRSSSFAATVYLWSTPEVLQALEHNVQFANFFNIR